MANQLRNALVVSAGISAVTAGISYYCAPFLKRMLTMNPHHFMGENLDKHLEMIVKCDIPIPQDPEEEFETDILLEWYVDQQKKGLIK